MKRKNILWGFVLLLVAMAFCYACTSCGDDKQEPQPSNPLLGAWEAVIDEAKSQQLEQTIVNYLAQNGQLTQETIDALNRVKEIVDYCINDGLYVIINDHWDGGWLENHIADTDVNTINNNKNINNFIFVI